MQTLKEGSRGDDVLALQRKLVEKGFSPGALDGDFGPGTEAAVLAFQQGEGLLADGVVGPRTAAALGFAEADLPPEPRCRTSPWRSPRKWCPARRSTISARTCRW
jgi:putative chitinase